MVLELVAICQDDDFAGILNRIECLIVNITGTEDIVFPYEESKIFFNKYGKDVTNIPILGGMHNMRDRSTKCVYTNFIFKTFYQPFQNI